MPPFISDNDFFGRVRQSQGLTSPVALPQSSLVPPQEEAGVGGVGSALGSVFDSFRTRGNTAAIPEPITPPAPEATQNRAPTREAASGGRTAPQQQTDFGKRREAGPQGFEVLGGRPDLGKREAPEEPRNPFANLGGALANLFGGA